MRRINRRKAILAMLVCAVAFLAVVAVLGVLFAEQATQTDLTQKNQPPSWEHPFGTDWMGRDMLGRTVSGLSMSIRLGLVTASFSAVIGLALGCAAAMLGKAVDGAVSWVTDLVMGIPHILLLILISFACGKGVTGVVAGITVTHWMSLARVIRAEVLQLRQSGFVKVAQKLGMGRPHILRKHILPHVFPQFTVGLILLFPHAILHEAAITFLGFGFPPEQPAIGVILSESMRYLVMGEWWLAMFPGLMLVLTVVLFDVAGTSVNKLAHPASAHE